MLEVLKDQGSWMLLSEEALDCHVPTGLPGKAEAAEWGQNPAAACVQAATVLRSPPAASPLSSPVLFAFVALLEEQNEIVQAEQSGGGLADHLSDITATTSPTAVIICIVLVTGSSAQ